MRVLLTLMLLFVASACEPAEDERCLAGGVCLIDAWPGSFDEGAIPCNPVAQTGCPSQQKCTWIYIDTVNQIGTRGCVPDGSVGLGGPCVVGPDGETTGYDDCVAGALCVAGACEEICVDAPDSCTSPTVCVLQPAAFNGTHFGACALP